MLEDAGGSAAMSGRRWYLGVKLGKKVTEVNTTK
jgi:hypothetical protein